MLEILLILIFIVAVVVLIVFLSAARSVQKDSRTSPASEEVKAVDEDHKKLLISARLALANEYAKEIYRGNQMVIDSCEPLAQVSVSKIGHEDNYHNYYYISGVETGDAAEVAGEMQEKFDSETYRDAYVVEVKGREVGELTQSAIDKIEQHVPWDAAVYSVADADAGKPRLKLNVYGSAHRTWSMDLRGINFDGREKIVKENGASICKLEPTIFEGQPAVKVLDPLDREMGYLPKENAGEVTDYISQGKISRVYIDNIKTKDDKTYARVFLVIKKEVTHGQEKP